VKPSRAPQNQALRMQSSIARTAFALCFEEGCILFLLVMAQALGLFDFRCETILREQSTIYTRSQDSSTELANLSCNTCDLHCSFYSSCTMSPLYLSLVFAQRSGRECMQKPSLTTDDENSDARNRTSLTSRATFTAIPFICILSPSRRFHYPPTLTRPVSNPYIYSTLL
jgi:hypothetical protein